MGLRSRIRRRVAGEYVTFLVDVRARGRWEHTGVSTSNEALAVRLARAEFLGAASRPSTVETIVYDSEVDEVP